MILHQIYRLLCAGIDLQVLILNERISVCLNALFSVLKHKVTVGKDTQNIKKAVCCSEVGQIAEAANCKPGHHANEFVTF